MANTYNILGLKEWADSAGSKVTAPKNLSYTAGTATASQPLVLDASGNMAGASCPVLCRGVSFTEASAATSYTGTIPVPAGSLVLDIQFRTTVLWDGTSASLVIGDDDDADGYLTATDLKATDMLVGEVFQMAGQTEGWLGNNGVYLVAATALKSATYYAAANNIIGVVTPGAADGTAGRSFMHVFYANPTLVASTNV